MASGEDNHNVFLPRENSSAMLARQADELEELRKRLERIRCSISRKDRVGRARAGEEAIEREKEMKARHMEERKQLGISEGDLEAVGSEGKDMIKGLACKTSTQHTAVLKESKAARRRRKKAEQEAESLRRVEEEKAQMGPSPKFVESQAIEAQLKPKQLRIHPIPADGHCLYSAVAHQMKTAKLDSKVPPSVEGLRHATADYLVAHREEFMPFIESVDGDEEEFRAYCTALRNEAVWGGQVEIKVMAEVLEAAIEVYAAGMPLVRMGRGDEMEKVLRLSYHRHYYGLGEHYNSVVPHVWEPMPIANTVAT